jgi:hypothetical protein
MGKYLFLILIRPKGYSPTEIALCFYRKGRKVLDFIIETINITIISIVEAFKPRQYESHCRL